MRRYWWLLSICSAVALILSNTVACAAWMQSFAFSGHEQRAMSDSDEKLWLGIYMANITSRLVWKFDLSKDEGVVVLSVVPRRPAAKAGMKRNDIIAALTGTEVNTVK